MHFLLEMSERRSECTHRGRLSAAEQKHLSGYYRCGWNISKEAWWPWGGGTVSGNRCAAHSQQLYLSHSGLVGDGGLAADWRRYLTLASPVFAAGRWGGDGPCLHDQYLPPTLLEAAPAVPLATIKKSLKWNLWSLYSLPPHPTPHTDKSRSTHDVLFAYWLIDCSQTRLIMNSFRVHTHFLYYSKSIMEV